MEIIFTLLTWPVSWPYLIVLIAMIVGLARLSKHPSKKGNRLLIASEILAVLICVLQIVFEISFFGGINPFGEAIVAAYSGIAYFVLLVLTAWTI